MRKEPEQTGFIYEELRQCEEYALMNMITFEAAIRNTRVKEILSVLNSVSAERQLDSMLLDTYDVNADLKRELQENYYLDYYEYRTYMNNKESFLDKYKIVSSSLPAEIQEMANKIQKGYHDETLEVVEVSVEDRVALYKKNNNYILHVNHNEHTSHTHNLSLPLHRPKMAIPHKDSTINIKIPMYHIHPKDIKAYYKRLLEKHLEIVSDAGDYYHLEELFFDETDETKSKASIYAEMFYVWDYIQWWKEKYGAFTPDMTARSVYFEIGEKIGASIQDRTGRYPKVEKYLENMGKIIDGGYKK